MSRRETGRSPAQTSVRGGGDPQHLRPNDEAPGTSGPEGARAPAPGPVLRLDVRSGEPSEHLFRHLLSAYLGGAGAFEIRERPRLSARTRSVVREFCRRTRQTTLAEDGPHALGLAVLEDAGRGDLDARLVRLGEMVLAFHREAVASWDHLPLGDDEAWERRDDEVDREAWYLERCISLGDGDGPGATRSATATWTIARSLERIADHAVTLGEVGPRLGDLARDDSPLRELRQFHRQAMEHLEEVLRNPDGSRANDLLDVGEALIAGGRALSGRALSAGGTGSMPPATAAAFARAFEAVGRTLAYSQDIAQAFFDRAPRPRVGRVAEPALAPDPVPAA